MAFDSKSAPCVTRLPPRVAQRGNGDCGIAALAGIAGTGYEQAQAIFDRLGYGGPRPNRSGYGTNYKELRAALTIAGLGTRLGKWRDWDCLPALAILKVGGCGEHVSPRDWHWVIAARHPQLGLAVIDGNWPGECVQHPADGRASTLHMLYQPHGSYIEITQGSPFLEALADQ